MGIQMTFKQFLWKLLGIDKLQKEEISAYNELDGFISQIIERQREFALILRSKQLISESEYQKLIEYKQNEEQLEKNEE